MIKCGKVCPVCYDYIRYKIMEDYEELFTAVTIGESCRCTVAFSAIPATFGDTKMKREKSHCSWGFCRQRVFVSPVLFSTFVDTVPTIAC